MSSLESVNALISRVMQQHNHPGGGTLRQQLAYYEEVHQELAPLARALEEENKRLRADMQGVWRTQLEERKRLWRTVYTCPECGNTYRGGDAKITIYADFGRVMCRLCCPTLRSSGPVMLESQEPR